MCSFATKPPDASVAIHGTRSRSHVGCLPCPDCRRDFRRCRSDANARRRSDAARNRSSTGVASRAFTHGKTTDPDRRDRSLSCRNVLMFAAGAAIKLCKRTAGGTIRERRRATRTYSQRSVRSGGRSRVDEHVPVRERLLRDAERRSTGRPGHHVHGRARGESAVLPDPGEYTDGTTSCPRRYHGPGLSRRGGTARGRRPRLRAARPEGAE